MDGPHVQRLPSADIESSTFLPIGSEVSETLDISSVKFWCPVSKDWNAGTTLDMATTGLHVTGHVGIQNQVSGLRWRKDLSLRSICSDNY
jgi:hypothetical protein